MNTKLLSRIKTTDERDQLVVEIETLLKSLYAGSSGLYEKTLNTLVRSWVSDIIIEETREIDSREMYLNELKSNLEKLEDMKLALAYEPTSASLERIHDKLIKLVGKTILIDLTVNKAIVGGAVIIYKGKYRDFSMKKIFDFEMKAAGASVLKLIDDKAKIS
jgi:hypothetical protein